MQGRESKETADAPKYFFMYFVRSHSWRTPPLQEWAVSRLGTLEEIKKDCDWWIWRGEVLELNIKKTMKIVRLYLPEDEFNKWHGSCTHILACREWFDDFLARNDACKNAVECTQLGMFGAQQRVHLKANDDENNRNNLHDDCGHNKNDNSFMFSFFNDPIQRTDSMSINDEPPSFLQVNTANARNEQGEEAAQPDIIINTYKLKSNIVTLEEYYDDMRKKGKAPCCALV